MPPLGDTEPGHERAPQSNQLRGARILVVEDDDDARELIELFLCNAGALVETASSAEAALTELSRFEPELVVSDIGMPEHDGYWLIERLRGLRPELPVVALTAFTRDEDRQRARAAGFTYHLGKPVGPERLIDVLGRLRRAANESEPVEPR